MMKKAGLLVGLIAAALSVVAPAYAADKPAYAADKGGAFKVQPALASSFVDPDIYGPFPPGYGYGRRGKPAAIISGQVWLGKSNQPVLESPHRDLSDPIFKNGGNEAPRVEQALAKQRREKAFRGQLPASGYAVYGQDKNRQSNSRPYIPQRPLHGGCLSPDC